MHLHSKTERPLYDVLIYICYCLLVEQYIQFEHTLLAFGFCLEKCLCLVHIVAFPQLDKFGRWHGHVYM